MLSSTVAREIANNNIRTGSDWLNAVEAWKPGDPWVAEWWNIDPEDAELALALNKHNRNVSLKRVRRYKRDMEAGRWEPSGQSISFSYDEENKRMVIADGAQRLTACVEAGRNFPSLVCIGLPLISQKVSDQGRSRHTGDTMRLFGFDVSNATVSTLRKLITVNGQHDKQTNAEVEESYLRHKAALDFAERCFPVRVQYVSSQAVRAAFASAFYQWRNYKDRFENCEEYLDRVVEIAQVLADPTKGEAGDIAILKLRDQIVRASGGRKSSIEDRVLYYRTQSAIDFCLNKAKVQLIQTPGSDIFPLPEDPDHVKKKAREFILKRRNDNNRREEVLAGRSKVR